MLSFVVPAYNEEKCLPGTHESFPAAARARGIDYEIVEGNAEFFAVTKSFHNALQGSPVDLPVSSLEAYLEVNRHNAERLASRLEEADFVLIHDPQPAAPALEPPAQTVPQPTVEQSFTWKERSAVVAPGAAAMARESCETPHHEVVPPCA